MREINTLVIHCSATSPEQSHIDVSDIRRWHTSPPNNWSDVGYHYVICRSGDIQIGRPVERPGAHVKGFNEDSIAICLVGGVDKHKRSECNFTAPQWAALEELVSALVEKYSICRVCGHRDFPNVYKDCPSFNVRAWWSKK
ncbi:hypothetical protein TDB9533_01244 [Thalassocella blandensis]|nr:hypothetical protein TDB9533_01244 [Thalassocella blandensis]